MATKTLAQNVNQAIADFDSIKAAIIDKGVSVPNGTPTSQYGSLISTIETSAPVSGTLNITSLDKVDVSTYQYAQVVDANIVPENIKAGVSILGVTGSASTSDTVPAQLGKPWIGIDWENDMLYTIGNPYRNPLDVRGYYIYINDEQVADKEASAGTSTSGTNGSAQLISQSVSGASYDLTQLSTGTYQIYSKAHSLLAPPATVQKIAFNVSKFGTIKTIYLDRTYQKLPDSEASDVIEYARWQYQMNLNDVNYDGETSGILNSSKQKTGKLYTYDKDVVYTFNTNPNGKLKPNSKNGWEAQEAVLVDGEYLSSGAIVYNNTCFAKVSFTLTETKDINIKYRCETATTSSLGIVIGALDTEYSSLSYSSKFSSPALDYTGSNITDSNEHIFTFSQVAPGDHFYYVEFYKNTNGGSYNYWKGEVTPVYEKIDTGKYLPSEITVLNANDPNPEYEWDPYTGKFSIPMTGNITMTAVASDKPLLDRLTITPLTWNVETSTLTWDYGVEGVTYYIVVPDGTEYTTTEKSYDFTGKLGESSLENKKIKMWAEDSTGKVSGVCIVGVFYNPNFATIHNNLELIPKTAPEFNDNANDYNYLTTNERYINWQNTSSRYSVTYDSYTDTYTKVRQSNNTSLSGDFGILVGHKHYYISNSGTLLVTDTFAEEAQVSISGKFPSVQSNSRLLVSDGSTIYVLYYASSSQYLFMYKINCADNSISDRINISQEGITFTSTTDETTSTYPNNRENIASYIPFYINNAIYLIFHDQGSRASKHLKINLTDNSLKVIKLPYTAANESIPVADGNNMVFISNNYDTQSDSNYITTLCTINTDTDEITMTNLTGAAINSSAAMPIRFIKVGSKYFCISYSEVNHANEIFIISADGTVSRTNTSFNNFTIWTKSLLSGGYLSAGQPIYFNGRIYIPSIIRAETAKPNALAIYTP